MRGLNKCFFIGNLSADPILKFTGSGTAVANFSIAVNESWKDDSGAVQERTEWINCVAWRKTAEICAEHLKKGNTVHIEGKMQTRSYEKDCAKKYITEIVVENVLFLGGKKEEKAERPEPNGAAKGDDESSLPF